MIAGVPFRVIATIFLLALAARIGIGLSVALERPSEEAAALVAVATLIAAAALVVVLPTAHMRLGTGPTAVAVALLGLALLVSAGEEAGHLEHPLAHGWYVTATCAVLTLIAVRGRIGWAGVGAVVVAVQVALAAGPAVVIEWGVPVAVVWVFVAALIISAVAHARRDAARAQSAAAATIAWQSAQDAAVEERQRRVAQTALAALPMLETIVRSRGALTPAQREDCRHLEQSLRDEIRGRMLLDDRVRAEVLIARRRGIDVALLDEGGIDELADVQLARIRGEIARQLNRSRADRIVIRTVAPGSETAVTVVGLDDTTKPGEEEVETWLEIPRHAGGSPSGPAPDPRGARRPTDR